MIILIKYCVCIFFFPLFLRSVRSVRQNRVGCENIQVASLCMLMVIGLFYKWAKICMLLEDMVTSQQLFSSVNIVVRVHDIRNGSFLGRFGSAWVMWYVSGGSCN